MQDVVHKWPGFSYWCWSILLFLPQQAGNPASESNEWFSEARENSREYRTYVSRHMTGATRYRSVWRTSNGKETPTEGQTWISKSGRNKAVWSQIDGHEDVYCSNEKYRFHIRKERQSEQWILKDLYLVSDASELDFGPDGEARDAILKNLGAAARPRVFSFFNTNLTREVKSPDFVTHQVERLPDKVRVHCSFEVYAFHATAVFEFAADDWRPLHCELKLAAKSDPSRTQVYVKDMFYNDRRLRTGHRVRRVEQNSGIVFEESELETDIGYLRQSKASDFRLSFFGLPEPEGIRWGLPLAVWLSLAGVALILGVIFFRWRRGRKAERNE